jgi:hypothetical protein
MPSGAAKNREAALDHSGEPRGSPRYCLSRLRAGGKTTFPPSCTFPLYCLRRFGDVERVFWDLGIGDSSIHLEWVDGRHDQSAKYGPEHRGLTSLGACVQQQRGLRLSGGLYRRLPKRRRPFVL